MARTRKAAKKTAVKDNLKKLVLAGVGAAVLAKEGVEDLAKTLVKTGEKAEPKLRKQIKMLTARRDEVARKAGRVAKTVNGSLRRFGSRIPLVTKKDLLDLARRIETLSGKVDALSPRKRKRRKK